MPPVSPLLPSSPESLGGELSLYVYFQENELELTNYLWFVVQWEDAAGNWHHVEGWQGTPDSIEKMSESVRITKKWWVAPKYAGRGPFRWIVSHIETGELLAISEQFAFPSYGDLSITLIIMTDQREDESDDSELFLLPLSGQQK